jgi:hypothetical protein
LRVPVSAAVRGSVRRVKRLDRVSHVISFL